MNEIIEKVFEINESESNHLFEYPQIVVIKLVG